ncbi:hypothetical protein ACFWGN_14915 [Oerskovia sp. NPDC060338]|uniref:hypothetical protein n=1 Tax=Oerskovia sp. NPDC060338 TaxID=3347100 RepID=UPI0036668E7A
MYYGNQPRSGDGRFGPKAISEAQGGLSTLPVSTSVRRHNLGHDENNAPLPYSAEQIYDFWATVDMRATRVTDLDGLAEAYSEHIDFASVGLMKDTPPPRVPPVELYAPAMRAGRMAYDASLLDPQALAKVREYELWVAPDQKMTVGQLLDDYDSEALATWGLSELLKMPDRDAYDMSNGQYDKVMHERAAQGRDIMLRGLIQEYDLEFVQPVPDEPFDSYKNMRHYLKPRLRKAFREAEQVKAQERRDKAAKAALERKSERRAKWDWLLGAKPAPAVSAGYIPTADGARPRDQHDQ